jgi:hypothetical protein
VQQLRETFPEAAPYRYAILDRDSIFNADVFAFLKATGLKAKTDEHSGAVANVGDPRRPRAEVRPSRQARIE